MSMIGILLEIHYYVNYMDVIAMGIMVILGIPVFIFLICALIYEKICKWNKKRKEKREDV